MYDYLIIGGGIVGLATARALVRAEPTARIILIDKEAKVGAHQTGHNSGVVHAGVYYEPGSLKAELCRAGAVATKQYCREYAIPFEECGKLIVATDAAEADRLAVLARRAADNNIAAEAIGPERLREEEPAVAGVAALLVRSSAIVDYGAICRTLERELRGAGVEFSLSCPAIAIHERAGFVEVDTLAGAVTARRLVACAGLQSDRIARLAGLAPRQRIVPFRGEYYLLRAERDAVVRRLIYPVPDARLPFLGVHLTRLVGGGVTIGPNAVLSLARERYGRAGFDLRDAGATLAFPGFWRVARSHWRTGLAELDGSISRRRFLAACQRYCPSLVLDDLAEHRSGIRAQAVDRDGTLVHDFVFAETDRMVHTLNAPSPAATSALPIGAMIADRIRKR